MHKSLEATTLDVYRQYKNVGERSSTRNGEEEVDKINKIQGQDESIRERHKEKVSVLQDIPIPIAGGSNNDDQTDGE